ncbi:recombinase family protein [Streptococcus macacae]|uniref:Transposon DNA-invertase Bin3 n=1 Tax=Streptococcus macacae NCTC 11558 TaxID=764298 RepID=G5JZ26_9STRE|nr:recombinase family protein [Streptococcus macacae]EHJ52949.1 putative transposon DNA-invertase Bin3 [Streptococcus macacae NCTC 11558]SUN78280.1 resolvase/integrase [Streptococcus macacae NCTC 11558]
MKYGYARVSTKEQNTDRQIHSLIKEGVDKNNIYVDKLSGKNFKRPQYRRMLRKLKKGDELYLKSIDRLGRNYEEIIEQWNYLSKIKGVALIVLDFPLLNTKNTVHGLTGQFLTDLVLQILSYVAQVERENIRQRQQEGIALAQKKGVRFGRPPLKKPSNYEEILQLRREEKISIREGATLLQVSPATFYRWLQE